MFLDEFFFYCVDNRRLYANNQKCLIFQLGGNWGGAYLELANPKDISTFTNLKFSLNKPDALVNAEIKLEAGATNATIYIADYTGIELANGFFEYTIPLTDFPGLDLSGLTIPFSIWNPQNTSGAFVEATVLIDNIYFSM